MKTRPPNRLITLKLTKAYGFRHRFGRVKKIPLHSIRHRFAERHPVVALRDDRFRQTLRHKPAIVLLNDFEDEISHKQHLIPV